MVDTTTAIKTLREMGGFWRAEPFGLIEIYGKDDARFLQAQTTNDVASLEQCSRQSNCLLDRKAHVQAYFDLYRRHESFRIIVEKKQVEAILDHMDHHRVADKVEFLDLSNTGEFFALQGPACRRAIKAGLRNHPGPSVFRHDVVDLKLWNTSVHLFRKSITGEDGYFIWIANSDAEQFWKNFAAASQELGFVELNDEIVDVARVEAGLLRFGVDFGSNDFLPETGLDQMVVSYTKGCFLGQEVLARVKSQGAPTRGMVGLLFPQQSHWKFPLLSPVQVQADEIMILRSSVWSPTLNRMIGFASAKRDYRMPGQSLDVSINGESCQVTVCATTFYEPEPVHKRAQRLYQEALQLYAGESDTSTQSRAVELLRWALDLDPVLEDAYEALGVILSKRGQLDEAITLMRQLAELNPDSVMAHTNLSVFYLDKGLKEQAEEEKAISMSIRMRIAAQQVAAQKEEAKKKTQDLEEAKQRMDMFKQVLEIDADDLLANYGVGSCYVSLGEFAQSVPFLKKAIQIKPAHTVAYISLGEAYEGLGDIAAAMAIYEKGIDVATKRGDMTPMHEMQNRLSTLKAAQQKEKV